MLWYKLSAQSKAVDFDAWLVFNLIDRGASAEGHQGFTKALHGPEVLCSAPNSSLC